METDRFVRQAGLVPRDRLAALTATIIGLGAIGRPVALQLAAMGVGRLQLVDFDHVELTNITTQGYLLTDLGLPKVAALARLITQIDPQVGVDLVPDRYRPQHPTSDVVFCCVDRIETRAAIWRSQQARAQFWADARMRGEVGRILTATDDISREHYGTTLFPQSDAQVGTCTAKGTIYTASIAAGLILHQFARWRRGQSCDADASFDLVASDFVVQPVRSQQKSSSLQHAVVRP